MTQLARVLCAVDIDDTSRSAFAHAVALARRHGARLLLLHAASAEIPFNRDATERVDFLLQLRRQAEAAGVDVLVTVQRGDRARVILLHARARKAELIVMGAGRDHRRLGSLAERVARDAPCPTLLVPTSAPRERVTYETVICAVDFSPASEAAARQALRMAEKGSRVTLVHVAETDAAATGALERLQQLIPARAGGVLALVLTGQPATELLRACGVMEADLLVIGARPRGRIGRRLLGRTGLLLRRAVCPIVAIPAREEAREDRARAA